MGLGRVNDPSQRGPTGGGAPASDAAGGVTHAPSRAATVSVYLPICDQAGNVVQLLDADSATIVAEYTYSPFGEILAATGPAVDSCPFRFCSRYLDSLTTDHRSLTTSPNLYYYGYRYYNPRTGKWLTRDPLGEAAGPNQTIYCNNDPVNLVDELGLAIYAFDGTNNDKDNPEKGMPTNVAILHDLYAGGAKHYRRGVGTGRKLDFAVGGFTGQGGKSRLEWMYDRLVESSRSGDTEIVIVGFSRGAAQAREFANMIYRRGNPTSYRHSAVLNDYVGTVVLEHVSGVTPSVDFMGLFDTVASFGWPGNDLNLGYRMRIPPNVKRVAQATAMNEYRPLFPLSSIMRSGESYDPTSQRVEKGFPGAHSDIGGGYDENLASLVPLLWMLQQAEVAGVKFRDLDVGRYFTVQAGVLYHDSSGSPFAPHPVSTDPFALQRTREVYH
ncbi:MAG: hypothetical protein A3K19_19870 [Lentisphaerae bacterium RIFOXYB12_FULL_65_16]|nr:MAG: hypothetical protein A3K19_19870 [Lentisphaerae bacterium RIFOXYB12_FULL_65_16]